MTEPQIQPVRRFDLDPECSIADRVEIVDDAVMVPAVKPRSWVVEAGIFRSDLTPVELAQGWHYTRNAATEFPPVPGGPFETLPGQYFYAGHYIGQFGHFLLETMARFWHLARFPAAYDGMALLIQPNADRDAVTARLKAFLDLCDLPMPPLVMPREPVRLERLTIPMQGAGGLELMYGAPEYREMFQSRFAKKIAPAGAKRIYISRTGFDSRHGSLVEEARLEALLSEAGYLPFHPQDHSLEDQIAQFKAAEVIAGVDGSAFHLAALVTNPSQRIVMFQRRPAPEVFIQAEQLRRFGAGEVTVISAEPGGWSPAGVRRSALSVFGVLDFEAAGKRLHEMGLIADPGAWRNSPHLAFRDRLKEIGAELGADMYEVVRPNQSLSGKKRRQRRRHVSLFSLARQRRGQKD
ncbi:Protein of unknown function [Paracoccus isoporae]|uniref:Glycosyltransferase 61 catalytic domain-containing protein n=1 Tax=Paracoccus isoporae TaxID=591205 RepID=A0A1G7F4A7_9RHOB|nr:glycosyltransferase family 61 protein [Paracoccus isoporae]SDE70754.1 Protein of unknown function [Paracoccus isoporae]